MPFNPLVSSSRVDTIRIVIDEGGLFLESNPSHGRSGALIPVDDDTFTVDLVRGSGMSILDLLRGTWRRA